MVLSTQTAEFLAAPHGGTLMDMTGCPQKGLGWMAAREVLWSIPGHLSQVLSGGTRRCSTSNSGNTTGHSLYDGPMRATQRALALSLINSTAFVWRLDTLSCDIGDRWRHCGKPRR